MIMRRRDVGFKSHRKEMETRVMKPARLRVCSSAVSGKSPFIDCRYLFQVEGKVHIHETC